MVAYRDFADVDMTEVKQCANDLRLIRSRLKPAMRTATSKSAGRVKAGAKANIRRLTTGKSTRWYPGSITFEMKVANASKVVYEIGPEKYAKQGFLASILEYGSVNGPPKPHLIPAMISEVDRYADAIGAAGEWSVLP